MILNAVVLWLHIFGAIGWLGGALVFATVVGPGLAKLSAPSRGEFFVKVAPSYLRFVEVFSGITLLFGVVMVAVLGNGTLSILSPTTTQGLCISVGAALALVASLVAFGVIVPSVKKMIRISESLMKNPGPPPTGLAAAAGRLKLGSIAGTILLIIVTVLMVVAATT